MSKTITISIKIPTFDSLRSSSWRAIKWIGKMFYTQREHCFNGMAGGILLGFVHKFEDVWWLIAAYLFAYLAGKTQAIKELKSL